MQGLYPRGAALHVSLPFRQNSLFQISQSKITFNYNFLTMFKCSLIGNLGKDAEIISTTNGRSFVSFPVAHTRNYTKNGVRQSETIWIEVNINYDITNTLPYLLKGTKVFVYGELVPKVYQSSKGAILNLKMFCDDLELCGVKPIKGDADEPLDISSNDTF